MIAKAIERSRSLKVAGTWMAIYGVALLVLVALPTQSPVGVSAATNGVVYSHAMVNAPYQDADGTVSTVVRAVKPVITH